MKKLFLLTLPVVLLLTACTPTTDPENTMIIQWLQTLEELATKAECNLPTDTDNLDNLATCLNEKWIIMYGTETCPYCLKQKELFGDSFKKINYINCMEEPIKCSEVGIEGIPARFFPK